MPFRKEKGKKRKRVFFSSSIFACMVVSCNAQKWEVN